MPFRLNTDRVDAALIEQTIQTPCGCRCMLVTKYHGVSFSTKEIVTCLQCADLDTVVAKIAGTSQHMRHESRTRTVAVLGAVAGSAGAFVATGGLSEILSGGVGVATTVYLAGRLAHLAKMIRRLRKFKEEVKKKPRLKTCRCVGPAQLTDLDGKCDLSFLTRHDDHLGNQ